MVNRLASWLPPVVWMALVLLLSSDDFDAERTRGLLGPLIGWVLPWTSPMDRALLQGLVRKVAHLAEYGVLATLWRRALVRETRARPAMASALALGIAVGWAIVDEMHQSLTIARTGSPIDVLVDAGGASLALLVITMGWRRWVDGATTVILWTAALGGAAALAVNWHAGVESHALWLVAPAALLVLFLRQRTSKYLAAEP